MSDTILIVGGPHDGKRIKAAGQTIQMLVIGSENTGAASEANPLAKFGTAIYTLRTVSERTNYANFYAFASLGDVDATKLLLQHYKPPAKP